MNAIGPVVAYQRRPAVSIFGENQAILRFAVIEEFENVWITRTGRLREIKVKLAVPAKERVREPIESDSIDGQVSKIDIEFAHRLDGSQIDADARGFDFGELIVEGDVDEVMSRAPRVDAALDTRCRGRARKKNYERKDAEAQRKTQRDTSKLTDSEHQER